MLIEAWHGRGNPLNATMLILADEDRRFVSSRVQRMVTIAQRRGERNVEERGFYARFFDRLVKDAVLLDERLAIGAEALVRTYGLNAADALHVACASRVGADEIVTTERPGKPIHLVAEIRVVYLPAAQR